MKMQLTAKKMNINQSFTDYAGKRLDSKLDRFFGDEADARLTLTAIRDDVTVELTVKYDNMIFRAEQSAADKNDALDACIDKIIRQIRKNKTKIQKMLKDTAFEDNAPDDADEQKEFDVVKHKAFELRPMNLDEAILQMNMLGHAFFMFKNGDSGEVNVVYKRDDGNYAVLEPKKD